MHGDSALSPVGECQDRTQRLVGVSFALSHLQICYYTSSQPSNSIMNNCKGFVIDLAVVTMEADSYLVPYNQPVSQASIKQIDSSYFNNHTGSCSQLQSGQMYKGYQ